MSCLIFIDTNIYLDFYRYRGVGSDASLSILQHFDDNHARIITTSQVEMEYKKNRQRVILDSLKSIKPPDSSSLVVPSFLQESKPNKAIRTAQEQLSTQSRLLKERTAKLLQSPSRNDPVYMVLQRLFKAKQPCHFHRAIDQKTKDDIRGAQRRFALGYPPRKNGDLSMGDSINWEWTIHCAQQCTDDIVIVSRDSDYGLVYEKDAMLNDWLRQEFKERVSRKRLLTLTGKLTEGFKLASITVTREQEESEELLLQARKTLSDVVFGMFPTLPPVGPNLATLIPAFGAEGIPVKPTFIWDPVVGATHYEFVLAEEIGEDDPFSIIDYSASTVSNGHVARQALKYSSTYNWRVRGARGSEKGSWTQSFFTTETDSRL